MPPKEPRVSRSTELTRTALIKAATSVFAEHGYANGSVRQITQKASANQAAITYHFGGKEGLYREVLAAAMAALKEESFLTEEEIDRLTPEEGLRKYLRQFLAPIIRRDRIARYLRIFAWESVQPTDVFRAFIQSTPPRIFLLAERVVRRFLPKTAASDEVAFTTLWLAQQPISFVRDAERLAQGHFAIKFDEACLDRLVDTLARLSLGGLKSAGAAERGGAPSSAGQQAVAADHLDQQPAHEEAGARVRLELS